MDKIVQGNTSNIVFLKSTDDSMLDTLQKMSGTTHKVFIDDKTVTRDVQKLFLNNEAKVSYRQSAKEMPVISYNDMAFISERNSIIFRAGDSPIWNRNETILPMSWRLFQNTITQPGKEYSLQTIPTLSSAIDFDVRKNQPDFRKMLDKRMAQAYIADEVKELYQNVYGYSDYDIEQLDPDNYADEIMDMINRDLNDDYNEDGEYEMSEEELEFNAAMAEEESWYDKSVENKEQIQATQVAANELSECQKKLYAGGMLSRDDLIPHVSNRICHNYDMTIIQAYVNVKGNMWNDDGYFTVKNGNLYGADDGRLYIKAVSESEALQKLNQEAKDEDSKVFAESNIDANELNGLGSYELKDAFYEFLVGLDSWDFADGRFDSEMKRLLME